MKKPSKPTPKSAAPSPPKTSFFTIAMDEHPMRYAIAGGVMLLYAVFYFSQRLFEAYNFNDFGEYYLRAQDWANGVFRNSGGSDILLSVFEYFAILAHPHDFLASYRLTILMLTFILMAACYLFIVRRNAAMPDFWTKLALVMLALSIPHFIFATATIDQSLLFAACLLFFLSTYNIPWAGAVSVFVFFSRPEATIIVPLYALLFLVDKGKRKHIAINFGTFVLLLVGFKWWMSAGGGDGAKAATAYQEYGFLDKLSWAYLLDIIKHLRNVPMVIIIYAYEALQSTFLWLFFMLGLVVSVRQRKAWPMFGVLLFYMLARLVFNPEGSVKPYSYYFDLIEQMRAESDYFIVKAFQKFDPRLGHGRYRLMLYPVIAFFVVQGLRFALHWPLQLLKKQSAIRVVPMLVSLFVAAVALYQVGVRYRPIKKEYAEERKLSRMHPVYKMGLELRKKGGSGAVLIDNFCDETDGSLLMVFSAFSGRDTVLTRFCKYGAWIKGESGRRLVNHKDYEKDMPANPYLLAKYYRSNALESEMYDSSTVQRWTALVLNYEDSLLQQEGITHVLAARAIPVAHLEVVDTVKGGGYIHRRIED